MEEISKICIRVFNNEVYKIDAYIIYNKELRIIREIVMVLLCELKCSNERRVKMKIKMENFIYFHGT